MVKMSLGASNSQSSSTSSVSSERISAYNNAISSLTSFISASDLQGQAYSSAKSYASSVLIPLIQGGILLSEAVSTSVSEFPSRYTSEVAGESLDSEVLEAQIATYQAAYNRTSALLENLMSKEVLNPRTISQVQSAMSRNMSKIRELQEKLDKLLAFDASSPSIFDDISSLESAVAQGLSQVNNGFSTFNGTFSIPSRQELAWVDTISSAWEKREKEMDGKLLFQDAGEIHATIILKNFYDGLKRVMDSDTAKRLSQIFELLPTKFTESVLASDGLWEILARVEKSGEKGDKAVDAILSGLSKYEDLRKSRAFWSLLSKVEQSGVKGSQAVDVILDGLSKTYQGLEFIASPINEGSKWMMEKVSGFGTLQEAVQKGKNFVGDAKFLGKGIKFLGKVGTVATFAQIGFEGIAGGIEDFSETGNGLKAVVGGALDAISSVGPLEGATVGATIGGTFGTAIPIPFVGTLSGAAVGATIGFIGGGINSLAQFYAPDLYDDVKGSIYSGIDTMEKDFGNIRGTPSYYMGE